MNTLPSEKFTADSKSLWRKISKDGGIVLTNEGKPAALLLDINEDAEETFITWKRFKVMKLLEQIRGYVKQHGYMFRQEINAEIKTARDITSAKRGLARR